jgi:hypothetical protein
VGFAAEDDLETALQSDVYLYDIKTGKLLYSGTAYPSTSTDERSDSPDALALGDDGTIAWLAEGDKNNPPEVVLRRFGAGNVARVIDRGADIPLGSFAASGDNSTAYWTNGSTFMSVSLRAAG